MNNQLKELAKQAGIGELVDYGHPPTQSCIFDQLNLEKFVELLFDYTIDSLEVSGYIDAALHVQQIHRDFKDLK